MRGSIDRVLTVIQGGMPDRAPLFDLLCNDAVLEHFAGESLAPRNAQQVVYAAYAPAIDATRPPVLIPARSSRTHTDQTPNKPDVRDGLRAQPALWKCIWEIPIH